MAFLPTPFFRYYFDFNETSAKPLKTLLFSRGGMKIKFMNIICFFVLVGGGWGGREGVCHKVIWICILSILFFV